MLDFFFFKQKTAYEIKTRLEFRRVLSDLVRGDEVVPGHRVVAEVSRQFRVGTHVRDAVRVGGIAGPRHVVEEHEGIRSEERRVGKEGRSRWGEGWLGEKEAARLGEEMVTK